jgi:predicted nucleic acid-binding protein
MILLDTNVLARMTSLAHAQCATSRRAVSVLQARREKLIIVPQNLYEFWAVATRRPGPPPIGQNGLGMTCRQASQWHSYFQRRFALLTDLVATWHSLVSSFGISGMKSFDVRLVAAMQTHGITHLLTFNLSDFKGFAITLIDPTSV